MIAALCGSRQLGTKELTYDNHQFGWKSIEEIFAQEIEHAVNGLSQRCQD